MKKQRKVKSQKELQKIKERKENWKTIGKSLFSNQDAIDSARHNAWWPAVIMFLVSIFIPIIPILVHGFNAQGSDVFANNSHNFERTGTAFVSELAANGIDFKVDSNQKLREMNPTDDAGKVTQTWGDKYTYLYEEEKLQYTDINENSGQYDFLVFYAQSNEFTAVKNAGMKTFKLGTTEYYNKDKKPEGETPKAALPFAAGEGEGEPTTPDTPTEPETKPEEIKLYVPNYMVISKDRIGIYFFKPNATSPVTNFEGDYRKVAQQDNLFKNIATIKGEDLTTTQKFDLTFNNWKSFLDDSFHAQRNYQVMVTSLISLSIFAGLGFFMGLMMFLLTRGKKNMFSKILSFWACLKIQAWEMLTPSILGMIMGFIMPGAQTSVMFFIIFFGIRIMWTSMRQLRPQAR